MRERVVRLYDSMGTGWRYQIDLLREIVSTMNTEVPPYGGWSHEIVENMTRQMDMNNCGIYVTAWAENAVQLGEVVNCIQVGEKKKFRKKMYDSLVNIQSVRYWGNSNEVQTKRNVYIKKNKE